MNMERRDREVFDTEVASQFVIRTIGAWAFLSGVLLFISGETRWQSPAYDILEVLPGSPYSWGILIGVAGVVAIVGSYKSKRTRNVGLYLIAIWSLFFALGMAVATINSGTVSLHVSTIYFLVGVLSIFMTRAKLV